MPTHAQNMVTTDESTSRWAKPSVLVTNDDGVEAIGLLSIVRALHSAGHPVLVVAPRGEQSASGMRLTLRTPLRIETHPDLESQIYMNEGPPISILSVEGTPCDSVIVALEGAIGGMTKGIRPALCVSGINLGPNLSLDVLHSGTVSAAREASMYGLPSIATSLADYQSGDFSDATEATMRVVDKVSGLIGDTPPSLMRPMGQESKPNMTEWQHPVNHFLHANILLNLNIPSEWNGSFTTGPHGARWYKAPTSIKEGTTGTTVEVGAATIVNEGPHGSDTHTVDSGGCAITAMPTWPQLHPLSVPDGILAEANQGDGDGFPSWLSSQ